MQYTDTHADCFIFRHLHAYARCCGILFGAGVIYTLAYQESHSGLINPRTHSSDQRVKKAAVYVLPLLLELVGSCGKAQASQAKEVTGRVAIGPGGRTVPRRFALWLAGAASGTGLRASREPGRPAGRLRPGARCGGH